MKLLVLKRRVMRITTMKVSKTISAPKLFYNALTIFILSLELKKRRKISMNEEDRDPPSNAEIVSSSEHYRIPNIIFFSNIFFSA
jgi:hypothetical protein